MPRSYLPHAPQWSIRNSGHSHKQEEVYVYSGTLCLEAPKVLVTCITVCICASRYSLGLFVHPRALSSRWLAPTLFPGLKDYPSYRELEAGALCATVVVKESLGLPSVGLPSRRVGGGCPVAYIQ